MSTGMRLDKYLGEMGVGTRSEIKEMAKKGRISVNGTVETKTDRKIIPESEEIAVDGRIVTYTAMEYYMLNKPKGVVSATEDKRYRTVTDLITEKKRNDLFPAGRLDIDTEGLLLLTNDGDLAHRLLSPKKHVDKVYAADIEGCLPADAAAQIRDGLVLKDGTRTLPAELEILALPDDVDGSVTKVRLTVREGKFHQVKRMFETLGCHVVYLKRLSMGPLILDESLKPGDYRPLTDAEIAQLKDGR